MRTSFRCVAPAVPILLMATLSLSTIALAGGNPSETFTGHTSAPMKVSSTTGAKESAAIDFSLEQNFPNPFNPSTTIQFSLPWATHVTLKVFNLLGEEIATLVSDNRVAGVYDIQWNASGIASGVYFYRMQADTFTEVRRFILLR